MSRVFHNLGLKILSLLIALLLWFHAATEEVSETVRAVPLQVRHPGEGLVVISDLPSTIQVRFRGKGKELLKLLFLRPKVVLDLSAVNRGPHRIRLSPDQVLLPSNLHVEPLEFIPPVLEVSVDVLTHRRVPVNPRLHGLPKEGYRVERVTSSPRRVELYGPSSLVFGQKALSTETVDLTGRDQSFVDTVRVELPPHATAVRPESVVVRVEIRPLPTPEQGSPAP